MKKSAHGAPIIVSKNKATVLNQVSLYTEKKIQDLIFKNPLCLPVSDIDESYNPLIPVCKELRTDAGELDIFMVTPNGDMLIIETKLWKNPGSRREVVGQILDYAKELSMWSYSDLQREINKNLGTKGNHLFNIAHENNKNSVLNETDFVDAVSRNLRLGKFLLIIAGDGIREGAKNLVDFINKAGNLNFSLAMVELPIFEFKNGDLIVIPKTIVKTVEIEKINIETPIGYSVVSRTEKSLNKDSDDKTLNKTNDFYETFWKEFVDQLEFDDPEQPLPKPYKMKNLFINPGGEDNGGNWISCYFMGSKKRIGVYFKFLNGLKGLNQKELLYPYKEDIKKELGSEVVWTWDQGKYDGFHVFMKVDNIYSVDKRNIIIDFFNNWSNKFVNVVRPRLKKIV